MTAKPFPSLFGFGLLSILAFLALTTQAQTPTPAPLNYWTDAGERVIAISCGLTAAQSFGAWRVDVLSAEDLQKSGANTPIEGLRQVPFFVGNAPTENDSNGGDGSAYINLYGLGPANVLTLINGRRAFGFSNINAIPISAVAEVDIVDHSTNGSASAGGVVNFTLLNGPWERPYEGAELRVLYGNTTDTDAHVRQVWLRGGVTGLDGKVAIAAVGEYYSRANLYARDREISDTADLSNDSTGQGWGGFNNNSTTYGGRISVQPGATAIGFLATGQLTLSDLTNNAPMPGDYRRFDFPFFGTDPDRFNYRAFTPAIPAVEKAMYYVTGRYKVFGDAMEIYGDLMYSRTKQDNGGAGVPFTISSISGSTRGLVESRNSPFNPAAYFLTSLRYRFQQELGDRRSFYDNEYQRYVAGIRGDLNFRNNPFITHLGYDSGFVYENNSSERIDSGDVTRAAIVNAIAQGVFNPFIGQYAPVAGVAPIYNNTDPNSPEYWTGVPVGTAPYDNRAAAQAASYVGHSFFKERDWLVDAKFNAHLFPNLWNGGVDLFAGYEHRETAQQSIPDSVQTGGDQLAFSALANNKYKQQVDYFFAEMTVPIIISTMNIPGIRSIEVTGGIQFESFEDKDQYSHATANFDSGWTGELALRYQVVPDLMLHASWRRTSRPPDYLDLFAPITQTFLPLFDPLPPPPGPPGGVWEVGNLNLEPETTDSYAIGLAWSPKYVPGFVLTVDAYQMFTRDLIVSADVFAQVLVTNNVFAPLNTPGTYDGCGVDVPNNIGIIRPFVNEGVFCVNSHTGNAGKRNVEGIEATIHYDIPTEHFGKFTLSGGYNHFFTWKLQPGFASYHSFLGTYNNGTFLMGLRNLLAPGAIPWNKGFLRGEWEWRGFDFVATGNYIGDFRDDPEYFGPDYIRLYGDTPRNVPSHITLDLQLSYEWIRPETYAAYAKDSKNVIQAVATDTPTIWQRMLWGTKVTVGVNNAFDRNPPSVLGAVNDNYDTSLYTIRNRYYYVALTKKF